MSSSPQPTLAEIQQWAEIPCIAHFCSLFKTNFDLVEFDIEELETALLNQNNTEDIFCSSTLIEQLVVKLLAGCMPMYATKIHSDNFSTFLIRLLNSAEEEAEEDGFPLPDSFINPFRGQELEDWSELSLLDQVKVLHLLTDLRLQAFDVSEKVKEIDADSLRVEPLGVDSNNVTLWYFYGTRLYREVKPAKQRKNKKSKDDSEGQEKSKKFKDDSEELKKSKQSKNDSEESDETEGNLTSEAPGWYLSCSSESEWNDIVANYKKSKKRQDKEIYQLLMENFMPDITSMFQEKIREENLKILMMNKRSSSRLDRKREEEERAFMLKVETERKLEAERRAEEARKVAIAKENKMKGREHRAQKRSDKGEWMAKEPALMANRKRVREEFITNIEEAGIVSNPSKRKNPAMREWERIHTKNSNETDNQSRNLRL